MTADLRGHGGSSVGWPDDGSEAAGLVLIGPFVRDHGMPAWQRLVLRLVLSGPWRVRAWDACFASLHKGGTPPDHDVHRRAIRANLAQRGRFEAVRAMMLRSDAAIEARLPRVSAPVLVVMGSADPDFPDAVEEARIIADATQGAAIVVAGAGHYPHVERPDEVYAAVASFLATLMPGARAEA